MTENEPDREDVEFIRRYRYVKIGYVVAGALFTVALVCYVAAIATGVGAVAGIGGIFTAGSFVAVGFTGLYHNLSGVWAYQERVQDAYRRRY